VPNGLARSLPFSSTRSFPAQRPNLPPQQSS
jgi:hypothetical protein